MKNVVSALGTISGNVSQGPNGLLANIESRRREQIDEFRNSLRADDDLRMFSRPRSDVGECPSGFELMCEACVNTIDDVKRGDRY